MNTIRFIQHYYYRATYYSSNSIYKKMNILQFVNYLENFYTISMDLYDSSVYVSNK